jgi:molecular chaperone GrpE (heat shock protein)
MRAVGRKKDPSQPKGVVLEEHLGGFMQGDTVLRPAEVIVNG